MEMIRHHHKFVEVIDVLISVFPENVDQDFDVFRNLKDGAVFGALCRDEVGGVGMSSVLEL